MAERPFSRHVRADFSPAACFRTGRDTDLIDLGGADIPGYGRVYLSTLEVADLAQLLGLGNVTIETQRSLYLYERTGPAEIWWRFFAGRRKREHFEPQMNFPRLIRHDWHQIPLFL